MNPFGTIDIGGFLWIIIFIIVAIIIYLGRRILKGQGLPAIPSLDNFQPQKKRINQQISDQVLCMTISPGRIDYGQIFVSNLNNKSRLWDISNKKGFIQGVKDGESIPILLPDKISYLPEKLARMIGCLPLKRLKSLSYSLLENLAPFAPVIAIAIGAILFLIIVG